MPAYPTFGAATKAFGKNILFAASKEGGGIWRNYALPAIKTGAIMGLGTGFIDWTQGGSFWEGVKSGVGTGALLGLGYGAFTAGVGLPGGHIRDLYEASSRVSKQVKALWRNKAATETANATMNAEQKLRNMGLYYASR